MFSTDSWNKALLLLTSLLFFEPAAGAAEIDGYWAFTDESIEKIVANYLKELEAELDDPDSFRSRTESSFRNQYRKFETIDKNRVVVTIIYGHTGEQANAGLPGITQQKFHIKERGSTEFTISNDANPLMRGSVSMKQMDYTDIETDLEIQMRRVTQSELETNLSDDQRELLNYISPDGFIEVPYWEPGDIFEIAKLDKEPKIKDWVAPVYPPELKRERIPGEVVLVLIVDEHGKALKVEVESSTDERFDQAAIEAVRATLFEPGEKDGKSVKTRIRLPISFTLRR